MCGLAAARGGGARGDGAWPFVLSVLVAYLYCMCPLVLVLVARVMAWRSVGICLPLCLLVVAPLGVAWLLSVDSKTLLSLSFRCCRFVSVVVVVVPLLSLCYVGAQVLVRSRRCVMRVQQPNISYKHGGT